MTRSTAVHVRILVCDAVEEPVKGLAAATAAGARPLVAAQPGAGADAADNRPISYNRSYSARTKLGS
jgi:hypothetical protein